MDFYYTVAQNAVAEFKDRGSRFIGHVFPFEKPGDLKAILKQLKDKHPKAAHYCFAYRIGTNMLTFRSSDDGEPSGTAGRQILAQMDSRNLTNALIVVVRYFGGSLLGKPGLIHAYKTTASLALQMQPIIQKPILQYYQLQYNYTESNKVMAIAKKYGCEVFKAETQLFSTLTLGFPANRCNDIIDAVKQLGNVELIKIL